MKRDFILILSFCIPIFLQAQPCFPDGIVFYAQEEVNQFLVDNPNCTIIEGDLSIEGYWIDDLSPLSNITEVQGNFTHMSNAYLYDFKGLDNLMSIGGTFRVKNSKIETFLGLENLDSIGGHVEIILNNAWMMNLDGLEGLKYIGGDLKIGGAFWEGNQYLHSIQGLQNLEYIGGNLEVYGSDFLTDLSGLEKIDSIYGDLKISSYISVMPALESLKGLDNLEFIGGNFELDSCPVLHDLTALSKLKVIQKRLNFRSLPQIQDFTSFEQIEKSGSIDLSRMPKLKSFYGLEKIDSLPLGLDLGYLDSITSMEGLNNLVYIGEDLEIGDLYALKNLQGLNKLKTIEERLYLEYNYEIESYAGLEKLEFVGGELSLYRAYKVKDLSDFKSLRFIGEELDISRMHSLVSLEGMIALDSIGGLNVSYNDSLNSLQGLEEIHLMDDYIYIDISENPMLTDISGMIGFDPNHINYFIIEDNALLSACAIECVCSTLKLQDVVINIENNAEGCLTNEEVEAICKVISTESIAIQSLNIFPNPTSEYIQVDIQDQPHDYSISLNNLYGTPVIFPEYSASKIDVSALPSGIYILTIHIQDQGHISRKIVIQQN